MGSGDWYGVPNYGEFVGVYLNKDLFAKYGIEVPTTFDELRGGAGDVQGERRHAARRGRRRVPARTALVRARPALRRPCARRRLPAVQERRRLARRRDDAGHREARRVGQEGLHRLRRGGPDRRGHGRLVHQRHVPDHGLRLVVVRPPAGGDPVRLGARRCSPRTSCTRARPATSGSSRRTRSPRRSPRTSSTSRCAPRSRTCWARRAACRSPVTRQDHRPEDRRDDAELRGHRRRRRPGVLPRLAGRRASTT